MSDRITQPEPVVDRSRLREFADRAVFELQSRRDEISEAYCRGWNDAMETIRRKLDE